LPDRQGKPDFGEWRRGVGEWRGFRRMARIRPQAAPEMTKARVDIDAGFCKKRCASGWGRLVLYLVAVGRLGDGLLDGFALQVGALGVFLFFLAAKLGFVLVADALGHVSSPVVEIFYTRLSAILNSEGARPHPSWRRISSGDGGGFGSRERRSRYSRTRCLGGWLMVAMTTSVFNLFDGGALFCAALCLLVPILEATG
jgi:hypothetical protein